MDKIIERIEHMAGVPGLSRILAERLSPTDLRSLLLEVYRIRSNRLGASTLLAQFESSRFVHPSKVDPVKLLRWDQCAYAHLPVEFQVLALSPVCPLGSSSVVAPVTQDWAVGTLRNTEVVSDSTNVLALESALRRRELMRKDPKSAQAVHLAASHRLLRAQNYKSSGMFAHFSAFALCSAGRDTGNWQFELNSIRLQVHFYLSALRAFLGEATHLFLLAADFRLNPHPEQIESELLMPIRKQFQNLGCKLDTQRRRGRGYYQDLCFTIQAETTSGRRLELVDGGCVDWTQKLLDNSKERLVISGIGSERLCLEFKELFSR